MQESFDINSSSGGYKVTVGANIASQLQNKDDVVFIIDERIESYLKIKKNKTIKIFASEENKSLDCMPDYISQMRKLGVNRETHLIAIGGGVIQDIATFLASIYMRGITWTYMPTTLLAMVDSCVGGKSSINVNQYKNLVGNFYPPTEISIDCNFVDSLDDDAIIAGLCEAAKICYAKSVQEFAMYLNEGKSILHTTKEQKRKIVLRSLLNKKWFIEVDEFDQNERLVLNFGHTFGHAIESASRYKISHGVAVGLGMLVAEELSKSLGLLTSEGIEKIQSFNNHILELLNSLPSLKDEVKKIEFNVLLESFSNDKKHLPSDYRVVLPTKNGELILHKISRTDPSINMITSSYKKIFSDISK